MRTNGNNLLVAQTLVFRRYSFQVQAIGVLQSTAETDDVELSKDRLPPLKGKSTLQTAKEPHA